jgi:hypothetical protein
MVAFARALKYKALPYRSGCLGTNVEVMAAGGCDDRGQGVDVASEVDTSKSEEAVHRPEPEPDPPAFAGDGDRDSVASVFTTRSDQALSVRVAADDTVHDDHVCARNNGRLLGDVADSPDDSLF